MKTFKELREKTLTPAEKKKREEIAKAMEKDNPDMPMDKKMAIATATAKRVAEYGGPPISRKAYLKQKPMSKELDEGRMKELHGYIDRGMSAQQIAKKMKLDVKTIQALMPKESVEEAKDTFVVYKQTGIGKMRKLATLKTMPKGKALDKVLDKYDADGVIAMSKIQRNKIRVHEAVSPAQQAAIAIAKKEKGEKPQEESRAYRDAMKGMKSRSATRGMATTKKDKDTEASDDDRKAASKNIIMQLRKASDLSTGANIEFEKGKGKVDRATAQNVLAKFNRLQKPIDKEKFQKSIKSLADIKKILGK
jgi:hypothetical protein